jgi:DNA polymerase-3 subunit epsilon
MTTLLLVDTETTGLDPERDRLIEAGAVLFDGATGRIVRCASWLLREESNPAEPINRLPVDLLVRCGWDRDAVGCELMELASECPDYVLAHNASFDRQWLPELADEKWICTCDDAVWPRVEREGAGLTAIALAYDVGVVRAHRAIDDCLTLAAVLSRVHEIEGGLDAWIARAVEPRIEVHALVSYDDRELAKHAGFRWDADRKVWWRRVRVSQLGAARAGFGFRTREAA